MNIKRLQKEIEWCADRLEPVDGSTDEYRKIISSVSVRLWELVRLLGSTWDLEEEINKVEDLREYRNYVESAAENLELAKKAKRFSEANLFKNINSEPSGV